MKVRGIKNAKSQLERKRERERETERQKEIGERRQKYFIKITFILSIKIQNGLIHYSAQFNSVDCNTL